jgi:hypothetical protein
LLTLDSSSNVVNVLLVLGNTTVGNGKLSVGREGSAVTLRKVVNDNLENLVLGLGVRDVGLQVRNLGGNIEPDESRGVLNLRVLGLERSVGDGGSGSLNLGGVVRADVD